MENSEVHACSLVIRRWVGKGNKEEENMKRGGGGLTYKIIYDVTKRKAKNSSTNASMGAKTPLRKIQTKKKQLVSVSSKFEKNGPRWSIRF